MANLIVKIHKILRSLARKKYIVEFYNENNFSIILSFYHLNSVYNGLVYIEKATGRVFVDWQYHHHNKAVGAQLVRLGEYVRQLFALKQNDIVIEMLNNYKMMVVKGV